MTVRVYQSDLGRANEAAVCGGVGVVNVMQDAQLRWWSRSGVGVEGLLLWWRHSSSSSPPRRPHATRRACSGRAARRGHNRRWHVEVMGVPSGGIYVQNGGIIPTSCQVLEYLTHPRQYMMLFVLGGLHKHPPTQI